MISATQAAPCTVVVSKGQSRNPQKRQLETQLAEAAEKLEGVEVLVVPHLYDLPRNSETYKRLAEADGHLIVVSWIYSRAAHWVLDRNDVRGQRGEVRLGDPDEEESAATDAELDAADSVQRVTELHPRPSRSVYCIDLKLADDPQPIVEEIQRIVEERGGDSTSADLPVIGGKLVQVEEQTSRRWYPVIDFDRCTNCMECVDFCLFGVYGIDGAESILVEQPDNCRKGCPACSRVCPENAIIFPQHKAPAIAGAQVDGAEGFKIDLSQLFGAPKDDGDPIAVAARERDEQLLLAGRDAVGIDDQLRRRQVDLAAQPKDHLDSLIDSLDEFDL